MVRIATPRFITALLFSFVVSFAAGGTATLSRAPQAQNSAPGAPAGKDRSQWRKLQRRMSKDEVRNLLGEPIRVSVSRYYESWDYLGGTVTFDSKGRLDFWSET